VKHVEEFRIFAAYGFRRR